MSQHNEPGLDLSGVNWLPIILFGVFILAGGFIIALSYPLILPEQASVQAQATDVLFFVLLWMGGAVFLLVQGLLIYSVWRFRRRDGDETDGLPSHGNIMLEIVWTLIPAVIVVVLAILSFIVWDSNIAPQENPNLVNGESVALNAVGQRYAWTFAYETNDTDINDDPIIINTSEMHTYVGQHVEVDMETIDVIHSFWVPAMRVKQDLLPGRTTQVRFTPIAPADGFQYVDVIGPATIHAEADANSEALSQVAEGSEVRYDLSDTTAEVGDWVEVELGRGATGFVSAEALSGRYNRYRIVCTELCGGGHGQMYSWVVVHESEEAMLDNWYDPQIAVLFEPPEDPVQRAPLVLEGYPCSNCHVLDALGWTGITGPSLNGIGERAQRRVGGLSAAEYLMQSIHLPNAHLVAGYSAGQMPYFGLSEEAPAGQAPYTYMPEEDLISIVAYLCAQVESGDLADSACQVDLSDTDATIEYLETIGEEYKPLYGLPVN